MMRTFHIGAHIWFILHFDSNGKMTALEEHDMREGGHLGSPNRGKTWEETFVALAQSRASGEDFKELVREEATKFLTSGERNFDVLQIK